MDDLKAAAAELRSMCDDICGHPCAESVSLAAQALEAWAWQQEQGAKVKQCWTGERWFCQVADGEYVADTPLGAVLEAMEGEKDGKA